MGSATKTGLENSLPGTEWEGHRAACVSEDPLPVAGSVVLTVQPPGLDWQHTGSQRAIWVADGEGSVIE